MRSEPLIRDVTSQLEAVAAEVEARFGGLSARQLDWQPAAGSWSVAQCLDHLIVTHGLYFPIFERLAAGEPVVSWWQRHSPLSSWFGRWMIRSLGPDNPRKMKTFARVQPSASDLGDAIVARFTEHQARLVEHLGRLPGDLDPATTIIASPLLGVVTYSLGDALSILVVHCRRHLGQARRVVAAAGFPADT